MNKNLTNQSHDRINILNKSAIDMKTSIKSRRQIETTDKNREARKLNNNEYNEDLQYGGAYNRIRSNNNIKVQSGSNNIIKARPISSGSHTHLNNHRSRDVLSGQITG